MQHYWNLYGKLWIGGNNDQISLWVREHLIIFQWIMFIGQLCDVRTFHKYKLESRIINYSFSRGKSLWILKEEKMLLKDSLLYGGKSGIKRSRWIDNRLRRWN